MPRTLALACLALLLVYQAAYSAPKASPSDLVGPWIAYSNYPMNIQTAVRDDLNVRFHKDGTFESTLNSVYHLRRSGKEVVWTTINSYGEWTLEDDTLTFHYNKIDIDYLQSEFPSITEASLEQAVQEQLLTPAIHEVQSFSDGVLETVSGKQKIKSIFQKSNYEVTF